MFDDNLSLYSRTYPAIGSMITGVRQEDADGNPFGWDADTYFASAYSTSPFLQELKANGYEIRLYTDPTTATAVPSRLRELQRTWRYRTATVFPTGSSLCSI